MPDSLRYLCQNTVKARHWAKHGDVAPKSVGLSTVQNAAKAENQRLMQERISQLSGKESQGTGITFKSGNKFFYG